MDNNTVQKPGKGSKTDNNERSVRAVERAIAILKSFSDEEPELTLTQIATHIGLAKPTVHRFLTTLEAGGFLARVNRGKSFRLGPALVKLASLSMQHFDLREIARPEMLALTKTTACVVHLGILEEDSVVYVEKSEPVGNVLQLKSHIGGHRPLHCTSLGKTLLAFMPLDIQEQMLSRLSMTRYTPTTIDSIAPLKEELATIRRQAYAVDNGECNDLVRCVGVPIFDHTGAVVCALSVSTVGIEIDSARFAEIRDLTIAAGQRISRTLGYPDQ